MMREACTCSTWAAQWRLGTYGLLAAAAAFFLDGALAPEAAYDVGWGGVGDMSEKRHQPEE